MLLLPLKDGELLLLELSLVLGEAVDEPVEPLVEEPVLPDPPTLCDDDCAIAAAENANIAASAAVERVFNIVASPLEGSGTKTASWLTQAPCRQDDVSEGRHSPEVNASLPHRHAGRASPSQAGLRDTRR